MLAFSRKWSVVSNKSRMLVPVVGLVAYGIASSTLPQTTHSGGDVLYFYTKVSNADFRLSTFCATQFSLYPPFVILSGILRRH